MNKLIELCGNSNKYNEIDLWIKEQIKIKNKKISIESCLFISGNTGIGKTYSINKICENNNLFITSISSSICSSSIEFTDIITKISSSSLMQLLLNDKRDKIILIDDYEILISLDRTINISLLNILQNEKLKHIPIICICSHEILKKIGLLKKKCKIIELNNLENNDLYKVLKKINEKNITENNINDIIKKSNNNLSQCINYYNYFINNDNIMESIDKVYNIDYLYTNNFNRIVLKKLISADLWLISLRYHENLILELKNRQTTIKKKNEYYKKFIINFSFFDLLMYNKCYDIAQEYLISLIYYLSIIPLKKNSKSSINNFTKILSYTSLQKKYIKKSYSSKYPLYQIGNYHINILDRNFIFFN